MPSSEKGVLLFQDKQESMTRFLKISTKEGWVRYGDSKAEGIPIHGVPSFNEVERLAITYLYSFGCDTNQLLAKPRPRIETTTTSYKKRDGEEVGKEASRRGLILFRQIGGFQIPGEYLSIDFGNNARVCNLSLNWKNVNLLKQCDTVNSDQIMAWIKNGKATVSPDVDPRVAKAKSLAIKGVSVCHTLGNSQDLFYPYALLEVVAVLENEATLSFQLSCPILADYPAGQP